MKTLNKEYADICIWAEVEPVMANIDGVLHEQYPDLTLADNSCDLYKIMDKIESINDRFEIITMCDKSDGFRKYYCYINDRSTNKIIIESKSPKRHLALLDLLISWWFFYRDYVS